MNAYLYQYIVGVPIAILQVVLLVIIIALLLKKDRALKAHFQKYGMIYGLIVGIAAVVGSLGFSEGFAYEPCKLCWIQRIFHYPAVVLFAVALKLKDTKVWAYSIWLSSLGLIVSLYQILMQFNPGLSLPEICNIIPAAKSCSDILVAVFGYITIPVMSATLFLALIVLYILQKKTNHGTNA